MRAFTSRVSRHDSAALAARTRRGVVSFHGSPPCLHHRSIPRLPRAAKDRSPAIRWRNCAPNIDKGQRTIVRALLAPEPDRALEALRQLPHFGSVLGDLMRNHVARMRTRGFRYDTNTRMFLRFDRFLQRHPELARRADTDHVAALGGCTFDGLPCRRLRAARTRLSQEPGIISIPAFPMIATRGGVDRDGTARRTDPAQRCGAGPASGVGPTSIVPKRSAFCWTSLVLIHRRAHGCARSHFIRCWPSATAPDCA